MRYAASVPNSVRSFPAAIPSRVGLRSHPKHLPRFPSNNRGNRASPRMSEVTLYIPSKIFRSTSTLPPRDSATSAGTKAVESVERGRRGEGMRKMRHSPLLKDLFNCWLIPVYHVARMKMIVELFVGRSQLWPVKKGASYFQPFNFEHFWNIYICTCIGTGYHLLRQMIKVSYSLR